MPASPTRAKRLMLVLVVGLCGLVIGFGYLKGIHYCLDVLWTTIPDAVSNKVVVGAYAVVMTTLGATAVAYLRKRTDVFGHSPLDGLEVTLDPLRVSVIAVVAVIITLLSGAVLGPEAGLIAIGTAIGTFFLDRSGLGNDVRMQLVRAGVLGALLALVAQLGFGRTINITTGPLNVAWMNMVGSIPVAATAALLIAVVRLAAYRLRGLVDVKPPVVSRIAAVGLAVGLVGVAGVLVSDANPRLILGSGEGFMLEVMAVSSVGTVLVIVLAKSILYCLCLGGGIRGGPIFPAMFLGAATGTVFTLLHMPGEATALAASGVLAGTTVGIALGWRALVIGGVVIGVLLGSWLLIAPSIVGLVVGRVVGGVLKHVPGVGPVPDRDRPATDASGAVA